MGGDIKRRLAEIVWDDERMFRLDGVPFALEDWGNFYVGDDAFPVMKPRSYLDAYAEHLAGLEVRNVVELGIRMGGSTVLFALLLKPDKMVSLDISKPVKHLERFRAEDPRGGCIAPVYRTSQDDEQALDDVLGREMDGPLDLVIDDASHHYQPTRGSFEILFPRLRPGGVYVIEDWQWAHVPGVNLWRDQPALSNLVFQLMMITAGHPDLIAGINLTPGMAFVRKGTREPSCERMDVESLCWMQGRTYHPL